MTNQWPEPHPITVVRGGEHPGHAVNQAIMATLAASVPGAGLPGVQSSPPSYRRGTEGQQGCGPACGKTEPCVSPVPPLLWLSLCVCMLVL